MITDEMVEKATAILCQQRTWYGSPLQLREQMAREVIAAVLPDIREQCAMIAETFDYGIDGRLPKGWAGCRRLVAAAIRDGKT